MDLRTCGAVIPCRDEARSIGGLVVQARKWARIWVVDDGSRDGTAELARAAGATVIRHEVNLGKGASMRAGLQAAYEAGCEHVFTLDGDGQHRPGDMPAFLERVEPGRAKLILGNRMGEAASMTLVRRWVNMWMSRRISRMTGVEIADSQCGFRLLPMSVWPRLGLGAKRFEVESEMLVAFIQAGVAVEFVAIDVVPSARRSHIRPVRDALQWLSWWVVARRRLRRVAGRNDERKTMEGLLEGGCRSESP